MRERLLVELYITLRFVLKLIGAILYFSGLLYILDKVWPPIIKSGFWRYLCPSWIGVDRKPATIMLWFVGIYFTLFGVASQRYENIKAKADLKASMIFSQLGTPAQKQAFSRMAELQHILLPVEPVLLTPDFPYLSLSSWRSLTKETEYPEMIDIVKSTVENWKSSLDGALLSEIDLSGFNLDYANLEGAILSGADLRKTRLRHCNLKNSNLYKANLSGCYLADGSSLSGANCMNAKLSDTNLTNSNLESVDFRSADLHGAILSGANLKGARFWGIDVIGYHPKEIMLPENHPFVSFTTGVDLRDAKVRAEQLCEADSLYKVRLDPAILEKIKILCPDKLEYSSCYN